MAGHSDHHELGHIVPRQTYLNIFIALLILTVITVAISRVDLGMFNLVVAMLVASVKAGLVAMIFMHLKYENPVTWMYVAIPIFLLFIMIAGIFSDNPFRIDTRAMSQVQTSAAPADHTTEGHH